LFWKNGPKLPYFLEDKRLKSPHLVLIASIWHGFKEILLFFLTCSQIWLSPLVDNHFSTHITKLKKKQKTMERGCRLEYESLSHMTIS
jgi:hypothetical protein